MTMRPALQHADMPYALSCGCGVSFVWKGGNVWQSQRDTAVVSHVRACFHCGRPLGFDADGNPIVGPEPPQQLTLTEKEGPKNEVS